MMDYLIYKIGYTIAMHIPKGLTYAMAERLADLCFLLYPNDRRAVIANLRVVLGEEADEKKIARMARCVFRNFAKYLVDFFIFEKIDNEYIKSNINVTGLENLERAISEKKGVILLSAHIGNWELGAVVISKKWGPISAIVLTHKNDKIDKFFTRQRSQGNVKVIKIGAGLRTCYETLKRGSLLAVLGDRDFSNNGIMLDFFGQKVLIPRGPAVLSSRLGSCIVPCFMIRRPDDKFDLTFEKPIYPGNGPDEEASVRELALKYTDIIESYVSRYPSQWFMFRNVWNGKDEDVRPDPVV